MKELKFSVTLLTDVFLNQRAATEGNKQSIDFIPGNNFLGIVAGKLYSQLDPQASLRLFHSNYVRFGDAHPMSKNERALPIPASFYYAKMGEDKRVLIQHGFPKADKEELRSFEPMQFHQGYYFLSNCKERTSLWRKKYDIEKSFAMKSAYDKEYRRSKEGQMYGYEALRKGSEWMFSVFVDNEVVSFENKIIELFEEGTKQIGRSRTAQYGLIKITHVETSDYIVPKVAAQTRKANNQEENYYLVYADARLIFLDEDGLPMFQPTAKDLGFENGAIDWSKTQIRTFQYAPWNNIRQARDTDRCGIEKGSVFCIVQVGNEPVKYVGNHFVGSYQNEGFGKVMINPAFLSIKTDSTLGEAMFFNNEKKPKLAMPIPQDVSYADPVFNFLKKQKQEEENMQLVYKSVNQFLKDNKKAFQSETFASQWGAIRTLAMQFMDEAMLQDYLFNDRTGYLSKGTAKERWRKNDRKLLLKAFYMNIASGYKRVALVNLASQMSKYQN